MVKALKDLPHEYVRDYLCDKLGFEETKTIEFIRAEDPDARFLFGLLDKLKKQTKIENTKPEMEEIALNFSQLSDLLLSILSGNPGAGDEQQFIDALMFAPKFYQRLLVKIPIVATESTAVEISEVTMRADDDVLEGLGIKPEPVSRPAPVKSRWREAFAYHYQKAIRTPVVGFAYAVLVASIFFGGSYASMHGYQYVSNAIFLSKFKFDEKVPYELSATSFRTIEDAYPEDMEYQAFVYQLKLAQRSYFALDYTNAINIFKKIEPKIPLLQEKEDGQLKVLLHEYYFYLGLSYFAAFRSGVINDAALKSEYALEAVNYLNKARQLSEEADLGNTSVINYYIALAHGFNNQKERAVKILSQLEPDPELQENIDRFIAIWSG